MGMGSTNLVQLMRALNGVPRRLGTITTTSASAKDNSSTAVPFTLDNDELVMVQPDADCYLEPVASGGAATAASGVKVLADQTYVLRMAADLPVLSVIRSSGDVNLKVWKLR